MSNGTISLSRYTTAPVVLIGCCLLASHVHVPPFTKMPALGLAPCYPDKWVQRSDIRSMPKNMTERAGGAFSQVASRIQRLRAMLY